MKKYIFVLLISLVLMPFKVYASGGFSLSSTSLTMYIGDEKTITIYSDNSVGKLNISSSNLSVINVSDSSTFIQTPGASFSFKVSAKAVGKAEVLVVASSDYATMDEEVLSGVTKKVSINVIEKKNNTNTNTNTNVQKDTRSTNNKLSELTIDGYELEKIDDNNYKLTVGNNVTNISLNAKAEDAKATVKGTGSYELSVGDNNIEVTVISESGLSNKINVVVSRKDGFYLDDFDDAIASQEDINIIIGSDDYLDQDKINKIKSLKKKVSFNYYDENKVLIYAWIVDGTKLGSVNKLNFNISNSSNYLNNIYKLSNYASGKVLSFSNSGDVKGIKIKYYLGDIYNESDSINVYSYNKENNTIVENVTGLVVNNGYIEFDQPNFQELFVTMSKINNEHKEKEFNIFLYLSVAEFILLIGTIIYFVKFRKK